MINLKSALILVLLIFISVFSYSQSAPPIEIESLDENNLGGNKQLVIDWVLGKLHGGGGDFPDSTETGIHYTGHPLAFGHYWNGDGLNGVSNGMDSGLVISNGKVSSIKKGNTTGYESDYFGLPGDEDLLNMYKQIFLVNGSNLHDLPMDTTKDAAVLEFLYRPYGDEIRLRYVFGSEEFQFKRASEDAASDLTGYNDFNDQMFDLFGISITKQNQAFNDTAMIPGFYCGSQDLQCWVNVANVNHGEYDNFYVGNGYPDSYVTGNSFDGQTNNSPLMVIHKPVQSCVTYKIKIAIEDFWFNSPDPTVVPNGGSLNSAVFLGGGSLFGGLNNPSWTAEYEFKGHGANDPNFEGQLIEGDCRYLEITYRLSDSLPLALAPYNIPFRIASSIYRDSLNITYDDGSPLTSDSIIFNANEIEKTIRITVGNIDVDHSDLKFSWAKDPCEKPKPPWSSGDFSKFVKFDIRNNSPIDVSANPKIYDAYCKDIVEVSIVDETSGGVSPLKYTWNGSLSGNDVYSQQVNSSPEIINVNVSDGCENSFDSQVQINTLPIIFDPIQSIFLCGPGQSATVDASTIKPDSPDYSITNVVWERSDPPPVIQLGDQPGNSITVDYDNVVGDAIWTCKYTIQDVCGDEATSDFEVNQSSLTLNNSGICMGETVELFTGTPATSYAWYKEDFSGGWILIGNDQLEEDNPTITTQYKLVIDDMCGVTQEAIMTVYVDNYSPQISLVPSDGEICNGETIKLSASENDSGEGSVSYEWSNGMTDREITIDVNEYQLGQNDYTVTTIHENPPYYFGCENVASTQFTVFENPSPEFEIDPSEHACTNTDVQFTYLSDTTNNRTFAWDFGDTQTSNQPNTTHQYTSPNTYDVNLYVEHTYPPLNHVCSNEVTHQLTVDPLPEPEFSADPREGCLPVTVNFSDDSQEILSGATYEWTFGDGSSDNVQNPIHVYDMAGLYSISLTVHNTERCFATVSETNFIQVNPNPTAGFEADPWITTMDTPLIDFLNQSTSDSTLIGFEWDFGDGNTSTDENPSHTFDMAGNYNISLRVETTNGCWDTTFAVVALTEYVQLFIPTAFTPNGDGLNDVFEIKGTPMADFNMYIYNRWGQQIWSTHNFEEQWNGEDKYGNPVEPGSYIYKIQGTDYQKTPVLYDGTVNVVR